MYSTFTLTYKYVLHWLTASSKKGHGIHSPFVFDFAQKLLKPVALESSLQRIETIRNAYLIDHHTSIEMEDRGAGSRTSSSSNRTVSAIARSALKSPRLAHLLHRMIHLYQIDSVLELGTSLGITTRYLAEAQPRFGVWSIEGAPGMADFTRQRMRKEGYEHVRILTGDFSDHLESVVSTMNGRKLIFIDGNHRYAPTVHYFNSLLPYIKDEDIVVVDDIHWSQEMDDAWGDLKKNERTSCFIDLFFIGIVFFRKDFKEKQGFAIRF